MEAARAFGEKMIKEGGATPEQRLAWAFKRALARAPSAEEIAVLNKGLSAKLAAFKAAPESAKQFLAIGTYKAATGIPEPELAAYGVTASVILNMNEMVTKP